MKIPEKELDRLDDFIIRISKSKNIEELLNNAAKINSLCTHIYYNYENLDKEDDDMVISLKAATERLKECVDKCRTEKEREIALMAFTSSFKTSINRDKGEK
jgi:sialic acid synthase SpsE